MLGKIRFLRNICVPQHLFYFQFQFKSSFNNDDDGKIENPTITEHPCSINQSSRENEYFYKKENELIEKLKQETDEDLTFYGKTRNKETESVKMIEKPKEQLEDLKSLIRDSCPTKAEKLKEDYYFYEKDKEAKEDLRASKIQEIEKNE